MRQTQSFIYVFETKCVDTFALIFAHTLIFVSLELDLGVEMFCGLADQIWVGVEFHHYTSPPCADHF